MRPVRLRCHSRAVQAHTAARTPPRMPLGPCRAAQETRNGVLRPRHRAGVLWAFRGLFSLPGRSARFVAPKTPRNSVQRAPTTAGCAESDTLPSAAGGNRAQSGTSGRYHPQRVPEATPASGKSPTARRFPCSGTARFLHQRGVLPAGSLNAPQSSVLRLLRTGGDLRALYHQRRAPHCSALPSSSAVDPARPCPAKVVGRLLCSCDVW